MHDESFFGNPRTWVGLAFILFFVFFGRTLWRALSKILDDHTAAVRAELEEASRLRREAETMLRDAEQRRTTALAEAKALIEGAKGQAERVAAATAAEAEASAGASAWRWTASPPPRRRPLTRFARPPPRLRRSLPARCWRTG
jgi:F-type H+-transporting ATPase subunit b